MNGGAQIIADFLVIGGRVIPIIASGSWIPGKVTTVASGAQQAQENQQIYSNLAGSIFSLLSSNHRASSDNTNTFSNIGNALGTGIGVISGLSSPKNTRQVEITQGSVYLIVLQAPLSVPASLVQNASSTQTTPTPTTPTPQTTNTPSAPTPQTTPTPNTPTPQNQDTPNK